MKILLKMRKKKRGFTIIEVLFSLLIISLALVFISKVIINSINLNKKSHIKFNILQKFECQKNTLISKPFYSTDLRIGNFSKRDGRFKLSWKIENVTESLKKINLSVSYKILKKQAYFLKSKFIREVKND